MQLPSGELLFIYLIKCTFRLQRPEQLTVLWVTSKSPKPQPWKLVDNPLGGLTAQVTGLGLVTWRGISIKVSTTTHASYCLEPRVTQKGGNCYWKGNSDGILLVGPALLVENERLRIHKGFSYYSIRTSDV